MPTLATILLTTPAMLSGLALLVIPVAAHLFSRQSRKKIVFPSIMLLAESAATQSRLFRLRHWLLLLLRCAVVVLVVWAFARPVWLDQHTPRPSMGSGAAVILLIDASASSGQQTEGVSLINTLGAAAGRALDALRAGQDLANIVYATAQPRAAFPELTANRNALREELEGLTNTYERADLKQAIALAGQALAKHQGPRRVVILSDFQWSNWVDAHRPAELLPPDTAVTFMQIEGQPPENLALSAPRAGPTKMIAGRPMQLSVMVANYAARDKVVALEVLVDGRSIDVRNVELGPWVRREVFFDDRLADLSVTLDKPGEHEIEFVIPADALMVDNRAYLVVEIVHRVPVIVLGDDDPGEPGSCSYFLARALTPRRTTADHYEARHMKSIDLASADLAGIAAVFVGPIDPLHTEAASVLLDYMRRGGGVVFFCGKGPVLENLKLLEKLGADEVVLPFLPIAPRDLASNGNVLHITYGDWNTSLLGAFNGPAQVAFSQIQFGRVWSTGRLNPQARVLLEYSDGTSALVSTQMGEGRFILANFSPASSWSELAKYGSFVALAQSLAEHLQPRRPAGVGAMVGQPLHIVTSLKGSRSGEALSVIGPDNRSCVAPAFTSVGSALHVHVPQPTLPGFYHVNRADRAVQVVAVNVDEREGDLRRADRHVLSRQMSDIGLAPHMLETGARGPIAVGGRQLWGWCFAAALAVLALEMLLMGIWRR